MKIAALTLATLIAGPALAQAKPAATTHTTTTTTAKPAAGKMTTTTKATTTKPAMGGMTAKHTTKTGKTITYDCSKAGNKNKTACKGK